MTHQVEQKPSATRAADDGRIEQVSPDDGRSLFDTAAHYFLDMSGEDFARRYDAGSFNGALDSSEVQHVATLRRFAQQKV